MSHRDSRATKLHDFLAVQTLRLRSHATAAQILLGGEGSVGEGYPHELTPYRSTQPTAVASDQSKSSSDSDAGAEGKAETQTRSTPLDLVDRHPRSTSVIDAFVHQLSLRSRPAKLRDGVQHAIEAPWPNGSPPNAVPGTRRGVGVAAHSPRSSEHQNSSLAKTKPSDYTDFRAARSSGGWVRTALANSPEQSRPALAAAPVALMTGASSTNNDQEALSSLRRELAAVGCELAIEQQGRLITEETHQRRLMENAYSHQLAVWSTQSRLTVRNAMRRVAQRPSQVFLESLREKDAAEIRALRAEVARIQDELRHTRQMVSNGGETTTPFVPPTSADAASDEERREWNELYRNLTDEVLLLRNKLAERESVITHLQDALSEERGRYLHLSASVAKQQQQQRSNGAPSWPFHTVHKGPSSPE